MINFNAEEMIKATNYPEKISPAPDFVRHLKSLSELINKQEAETVGEAGPTTYYFYDQIVVISVLKLSEACKELEEVFDNKNLDPKVADAAAKKFIVALVSYRATLQEPFDFRKIVDLQSSDAANLRKLVNLKKRVETLALQLANIGLLAKGRMEVFYKNEKELATSLRYIGKILENHVDMLYKETLPKLEEMLDGMGQDDREEKE